jgi:hypothetical protein
MTARVALASVAVAAAIGAAAPAANGASGLTVSVDRTALATTLGQSFTIRSTITNRSSRPASGLIAHLNVLSLGPALYVDPEDWSSDRTRFLAPLGPGRSTTLTWKLSAVNAGDLGAYIAVLPRAGSAVEPTAGPVVRVQIAEQRTIDAGGILPLALGVPALLGGLAVLVRRLRRPRP